MRVSVSHLPWHDAVVEVLRAHARPMRVVEIRKELLENGYTASTTNFYLAITNALKYRREHHCDVELVGTATWQLKQ